MHPRYPYTLREDAVFTQHQLVLHYKQNYCTNIVVLKEPKDKKENKDGGAKTKQTEQDSGPTYEFYSYIDDESL